MASTPNLNKLYVGQRLNVGDKLQSHNGCYQAVMQADGNFVVFTKSGKLPMWESGTQGSDANHCILQEDGNVVVYTPDNQPRWATNTTGKQAQYLVMQNDGDLVLYGPDGRLWASNTHREQDKLRQKWEEELYCGDALVSCNGRFRAIMQHDGNFVVYESGNPLWTSNTHGSAGHTLIMQNDGDVVLYAHTANAVWASGTKGKPADHLTMQDDGNLVLYDGKGGQLWATKTT